MITQALILPLDRLTLKPVEGAQRHQIVPKGLFCAKNKVHVKTSSDDRRNEIWDLDHGMTRNPVVTIRQTRQSHCDE
ncbi:hypothetical protein J1N35_032639 [Gossypium stocksii]|uniref:Uncharacterized protein n=1 Tax=Gossypium stocksii TaxID=47602 RepID=A0A9D3V407_9ROSI|nr:hypothetical protein J1N35_032639 [Gossypium stocksii]